MNAKQRKVLAAIFFKPTLTSIVFADIESLMSTPRPAEAGRPPRGSRKVAKPHFLERALGGTVAEREGSRVSLRLLGEEWRCHRPHPGNEAKRYQVEQARELLERAGVRP